ncbi:MAG: hypothetical protein LBC53_04405 [Spirochaetaceae bacterium]|jgi:hypothetical protein|nr:hypothetical protein [Spirochaetaceae bacterium]
MKKNYILVIMLIIGFSIEAQQNQLPNIEMTIDNIPDWVYSFRSLPSEDKIWGMGAGKLSAENASCELAKFNAQASLCQAISSSMQRIENKMDNPSPSEKRLLYELNFYQNEFYSLLELRAAEQVAFELNEFIKIERRTKTKDGSIWYLVSIQKNNANKFEQIISNYKEKFIESYTEARR